MVRKNYYLSGPSFTVNATEDELTCVFENPRALNQVSVSHAAFTLDLAGPDPPMQLYLRSDALAQVTTSNARELTAEGQERTTDILGHVTLVNAHDLSSTGHYELQRPVPVGFRRRCDDGWLRGSRTDWRRRFGGKVALAGKDIQLTVAEEVPAVIHNADFLYGKWCWFDSEVCAVGCIVYGNAAVTRQPDPVADRHALSNDIQTVCGPAPKDLSGFRIETDQFGFPVFVVS